MIEQAVKEALKYLYWCSLGLIIKHPPLPQKPCSFLFVCKGNLCRSPFAERISRKILNGTLNENATFSSCGIEAKGFEMPPKEAVEAARGFGIDMKEHKPTRIDKEYLANFDMIIAMDAVQYYELRRNYPGFRRKVFLLSLFEKDVCSKYTPFLRYNIPDPYNKSIEQFILCYERIERCLLDLFKTVESGKVRSQL